VTTPATEGRVPEGGWPTGPGAEADDADAEGDTHHLWSVSLTDPQDVRDEGLTVGSVAFTDEEMVWTDGTNGDPGLVHVRDLSTDEEHAFDPGTGERCNLLGFGAAGDRIVMSQYCGTYALGVRDDRVQVVDTDGEQVVTLQQSGVEGHLASTGDPGGGGDHRLRAAWRHLRLRPRGRPTAPARRRRGPVRDGWRADPAGPAPVEHAGQPGPRCHPVAG